MMNERIQKTIKSVGVIPARFGSTRLPGKPLADISGKPMIQWVIERARRARLLSGILVATDDQNILDQVRAFGTDAVMTPEMITSGTADFSIVRLHGLDRQKIEARTGGIWGEIVEPEDEELKTTASIIEENTDRKITTFVNVNNHYEGSAPLTIQRILRLL